MLEMQWIGMGVARISHMLERVSDRRIRTVLRRAINHTGDKTFTLVKRTLSKQVGVPQNRLVTKGKLRKYRASQTSLNFSIVSRGGFLSLKEFRAHQFAAGVKASPWGRRQMFAGAWMGPKPGVLNAKLGGHVYVREGSRRLPIRKLWGPAIPREMLRNETEAAFQRAVTEFLPARVAHELKVISDGTLSD